MILDGSTGRVHQAIGAEPTIPKFDAPPGMRTHAARKLEREMSRAASHVEVTSYLFGDPPILWSAVLRLPDGAVAADEGGGEDSIRFILMARDQPI